MSGLIDEVARPNGTGGHASNGMSELGNGRSNSRHDVLMGYGFTEWCNLMWARCPRDVSNIGINPQQGVESIEGTKNGGI
jgi:hypothetical protein